MRYTDFFMATTRSAIQPASTPLVCGEHGDHDGEVIGCCHICGLLLCRGHANYLPTRGMGGLRRLHEFGVVHQHEASPLVCGDHALPFAARPGVPGVLPAAPPRENLFRKWWGQIQAALRPRRSARRQPPPPHSRRG